MSWYKQGTVSLTNGSATVNGGGTDFIGAVNNPNIVKGFAFLAPDANIYEVDQVISSTSFTLVSPYIGPTVSNAPYGIFQTQGIISALSTQVAELLTTFGPMRDAVPEILAAISTVQQTAIETTASAASALSSQNAAATSEANAANSSTAAAASASSALASASDANFSLISIKNLYYGAFSTPPTVRPDGSTIQTGDRYFDSASGVEMTWNGSEWTNQHADLITLATTAGASYVGYSKPGPLVTVQQQLDMMYYGIANVLDTQFAGGAKGDGVTDDTAAIQAAADSSSFLYFPATAPNYYKITSPISLRSGMHVQGIENQNTIIGAWGCDAFTVPGGSSNVTVENIEFRGYTSTGAIDAKLFAGVRSLGTQSSPVNYLNIKRCYFRGWLYCIDWQYTWNSNLYDTKTLNCTNGLRLFGQSVNNFITNCNIQANGGNASIITQKDVGGARGEGLMVTGSLLASGNYGITSDGFLSMNIIGCTIDLIQDTAIDLLNVPSFMLSTNWIYAANNCVRYNSLSVPVEQGGCLSNNSMTTTANGGKCVYVQTNNIGVSIVGGEFTCGANSRLVHVDGDGVSVVGIRGINTGTNASIFFNASNCVASNNTGSTDVQWNVGVPSQQGMPVAITTFNGTNGTATLAHQCSVVRNNVGDYTITFLYPLVSAAYAAMITMDRSGNTDLTYSLTNQTPSNLNFQVYNQNGALTDSQSISVVIFN